MATRESVRSVACRRSGLTLVEVSVCLTALCALLAGVAPALRDVRQSSHLRGCQDRLGRIAQASHLYAAADPDELAIPIGVGDARPDAHSQTHYYGYGGKSGVTRWSVFPESPFSGGPLYQLGAADRPLNAILYKQVYPPPIVSSPRGGDYEDWTLDARWDLDVYRCPADDGFSGMHHAGWRDSGLRGYDYHGTSYVANSLLRQSPPPMPFQSISPYARAISSIPVPDMTIGFMEGAAKYAIFANNPDYQDQGSGCYWPFPIGSQVARGWHGQDFRFNVSFIDGHVTQTEIRGYGRQPQQICPPGVLCQCITPRTANWRMDVFPAPLVPTTKYSSTGDTGIFEVVP